MTVIALAGRRIDAPGAKSARFPEGNLRAVKRRVSEVLRKAAPAVLVCSGACGADLVALDAAGQLGMRRRVVLPFAPERFRETSVVDRLGAWGAVFDRVVGELQATGDLVVLGLEAEDAEVYGATNRAIWDEAERLAGEVGGEVAGVVVWDGRSRGAKDWTEHFVKVGRERGVAVLEVGTR